LNSAWKYGLLALLIQETLIYAKPIPNGYCSKACCEHLPWYEVTTRIGTIVIGWRKSVILINWSGTILTRSAEDIFPAEKVTKFDQTIHAWGYAQARTYLAVLLDVPYNKYEGETNDQ
jgi:hypothetical protein